MEDVNSKSTSRSKRSWSSGEEKESYGEGWVRPNRKKILNKNRSKTQAVVTVTAENEKNGENNFQPFKPLRTSLPASTIFRKERTAVPMVNNPERLQASPPKRMKPGDEFTLSNSSLSPDPKSLTRRMTTRDNAEVSPNKSYTTNELDLLQYLPTWCEEITPTRLKFGQRQSLRPAPSPISPSSALFQDGKLPLGARSRSIGRRLKTQFLFGDEKEEVSWKPKLCLDWSLKSSLKIESAVPFGWSSTALKASEESSGTTAFARCIDITRTCADVSAEAGEKSSMLDTSLGAQFHAACLYWQFPHVPSFTLFPRLGTKAERSNSSQNLLSNSPFTQRLDENIIKCLQLEWIEAFRSSFHLLRSRQCPFFYLCAPQFTALFAAAGTQEDERVQIYVNPTTKGFRDALKSEGIHFTMPYSTGNSDPDLLLNGKDKGKEKSAKDKDDVIGTSDKFEEGGKNEESDEETDKWLDDMGISQDIEVSNSTYRTYTYGVPEADVDNKKTLLLIAGGSESLSFFNFLLNAKQYLVALSGAEAGIPPTILSPTAFHAATMQTLKVKQGGSRRSEGGSEGLKYNIELIGPILPNVTHQLTSLLSDTVKNYTVHCSTLKHTIALNLYSEIKMPVGNIRPPVFELQNLSDCGLSPSILSVFCKCDNCDTIRSKLICKDTQFSWS